MKTPTVEQFLKDVTAHKMRVDLDAGKHRHLIFRGTSNNMWFELVTWPGSLTISGDMGTWTFSRPPDMFNFFRGEMKINPSYWAEKLQHGNFSVRDGGRVWDQDKFQERLIEQLQMHFEDEPEKFAEVKASVEDEVFRCHDGDGADVMRT